MTKANNSLYLPTRIRFTFQVWALLSVAIVVFAVLATLLTVAGMGDNRSIILSFCLTSILTLSALPFVTGFSTRVASARGHKLERRHLSVTQVFRRLCLTFAGAPLYDLIVDLMRILGIVGLITAVFLQHSTAEAVFDLTFAVSLFFVVFHAFIYPFIRTESVWEKEYRYRKLLITNAINNVANASVNGVESTTLKDIELTALRAIKSFLEFAVLDKKRNHFHVNLIIEHPFDRDKLICIQRTNPTLKKRIPTFYEKEDMPTAMKVIEECTPVYISRFVPSINVDADYEMVWQIPMLLRLGNEETAVGIVAIDSTKPHHLDLDDKRATLLFNLTPYLALIRFSLMQRYLHGVWDDVIKNNVQLEHPHLRALAIEDRESHRRHVEAEARLDRNPDKESFDVVFQNLGGKGEQIKRLRSLAADLSQATTGRKVFGTLFPYVENNNRRIHG